jgi:hypothetical protein
VAKLLLIDADLLVYRCGFAVEKNKYLVEFNDGVSHWNTAAEAKKHVDEVGSGDIWTRKEVEPVENALALVKNVIQDIQDRYAEWSDCRLWLSPSVGNFREQIATRAKYKGNRDNTPRPVHATAIRDCLVKQWGAVSTVGQEADDAIGIDMSANPGSVCVSFDKDLLQLPGKHYDWVDKSERDVTSKEAAKFFWQQALSGDATDNVPGCKGIGSVKAQKLLAECNSNKECWDKVLEVYKEVHGDEGEAFATETARLVYVRRKNNEMWSPPK